MKDLTILCHAGKHRACPGAIFEMLSDFTELERPCGCRCHRRGRLARIWRRLVGR